jgi:hypothetical protein
MLGYVVAARGVGNLYPLSTFEMYGATRLVDASRIVVIAPDGPHEVERFAKWRCDRTPDPDPRQCGESWPFFHIEASDRAAIDRVRNATVPGTGATPVLLVRRVWRLDERDTSVQIEDCELARCEAER